MNRAILFRGKRIDNGKWVYGGFWLNTSLVTTTIPHIIDSDGITHEVDPATIGQFTGLTDKCGKKIFEGDILRQKRNGVYGLPVFVVFDDGAFMWYVSERSDLLYQSICDTFEVIGNIHENPELEEQDD